MHFLRASSISCFRIRPYGKSWKSDLERMGGKDGIKDPRFVIEHAGDPEYSLITRSSDGQMLFLANMLSKMKHNTPLGSRIAEVHNGSSLFTGDAGQGESNIRRWIIESDWLEAIVALPLNMFYNTGIATYIWVITNRKPEHRRDKVQLIDATQWFKPLRKNLGKKNCELSEEDIQCICETFLAFKETEQSKIFPNAAFGYWKVTVERPLRLKISLDEDCRRSFRSACVDADEEPIANVVDRVAEPLGPGPHTDFNIFLAAVERDAEKHSVKLTAKRKRLLQTELAERDERAERYSHESTNQRRLSRTRFAVCSRSLSKARRRSSSTSPTRNSAIPSRCRCWKKGASKRFCGAKSCLTPRMPGMFQTA